MLLKLMFLGVVTLTSYEPLPSQTKPECRGVHDCYTANGDTPTRYGVAVSRDFLSRYGGPVAYGDMLCIDGFGCRVVNDCMAARHRRSVDLMVWTKEEERKVGVRKGVKIWLVSMRKN